MSLRMTAGIVAWTSSEAAAAPTAGSTRSAADDEQVDGAEG